jgi:hypothetical protein
MNDAEIDERVPRSFTPYLRKKIAHRLLHPVALGSPEWHFLTSLLHVMADDPDNPQSAWRSVARVRMNEVNSEVKERCEYVIGQTIKRLRHHSNRVIGRMTRALEVLDPSISIPPYRYETKPPTDRRALKRSYRQLLERISRILYQHDPVGISGGGESEYDPEAQAILPQLVGASSEDDVKVIIREEFRRWFGSTDLASLKLATVAAEIWKLWQLDGTLIKDAIQHHPD